MLTSQQQEQFKSQGFIRLSAGFSKEDAGVMEDKTWAALESQNGVIRTNPESWTITHGTHLQQLKTDPAFAAIGSTVLIEAIDDLLGSGSWKKPRDWGQLLVSFPTENSGWRVPSDMWHADFGFDTPVDQISGLLVLSFISNVPARSGGTTIVSGSHRLIQQFIKSQPKKILEKMKRFRKAFLASDSWLVELTSERDETDRIKQFMETEHVISGNPVRVVELTGTAGDVVITHPWLLHCPAPHCGTHPRIMCVQRIHTN